MTPPARFPRRIPPGRAWTVDVVGWDDGWRHRRLGASGDRRGRRPGRRSLRRTDQRRGRGPPRTPRARPARPRRGGADVARAARPAAGPARLPADRRRDRLVCRMAARRGRGRAVRGDRHRGDHRRQRDPRLRPGGQAEEAVAALQRMAATTTAVRRDGRQVASPPRSWCLAT